MSTQGDIVRGLNRLLNASLNRVIIAGGKRGEGEMKYRIFNEGLDAERELIGAYSSGYAAYRRARGRQTSYVDLEFTGELRNAIKLGTAKGGAVTLGITNSNRANVAAKLEKQYQKTIFALSDVEVKQVEQSIILEIDAIFSRL